MNGSLWQRILPAAVDNEYGGSPIALYAFYALILLFTGRSLVHVFSADGGAGSIATIPLDTFTAGGAEAVIYVFALWGIAQLAMCGVYLLVALRYRSLIPLMYLFILFEWLSRLGLGLFKSVATTGTAPAAVGALVFPFVALLLFYLSLRPRAQAPVAGTDDFSTSTVQSGKREAT